MAAREPKGDRADMLSGSLGSPSQSLLRPVVSMKGCGLAEVPPPPPPTDQPAGKEA